MEDVGEVHESPPWQMPTSIRIKRMKTQKRALQDRLFEACESPTKKAKTKTAPAKKVVNIFSTKDSNSRNSFQHIDDSTCEDSTLMDLLGLRPIPDDDASPARVLNFSRLLSPSPSKLPLHVCHASPIRNTQGKSLVSVNMSPLKGFANQMDEDGHGISSSSLSPNRKTLIPKRLPLSPSFSAKSISTSRPHHRLTDLPPPSDGGPEWNKDLCLDWSLKSGLTVISPNAYGWSSNNLKTSEESSGVSAFVRCIDIEPPNSFHPLCPSSGSSQLDTSLGAQFHQCCLYWQHPSIPSTNLFPREIVQNQNGHKSASHPKSSVRFEKHVSESMVSEWVEACRSAFQLLKARQCPYFYVCANSFTSLFCSAGTQGDEQTQVYVSPSTKPFRDALTALGINFSMPYASVQKSKSDSAETGNRDLGKEEHDEGEEGQEQGPTQEKLLEELGFSQNVKVIIPSVPSVNATAHEKSMQSLILICGSETLAFFNFLINAKTLLVANVGPFAGVPPTILSPVAFHGATLKTLKVQQKKVTVDSKILHSIDMKGPILPHVLHMLCSLLNKTVKNYKIRAKTLESTVPLNLYSNVSQTQGRVKPSAFDLQNLSDCGLKRDILEVFCKCDNCDTIREMIEGKRGMYRWF